MKYQSPSEYLKTEVESAIEHDVVSDLIQMVISVSIGSENADWAESVCRRLVRHSDEKVHGNAILGFGHIARVHGKLDLKEVAHLVSTALSDDKEYVRGQAESAADDLEQYMEWDYMLVRT